MTAHKRSDTLRFMPITTGGGPDQPMRADARRNRRRLLDAAIGLILEAGGEPSRDAVAQRAGVGIGTLYRHFPDQQALLHAVAFDVLDRTIAAGEATLADTTNGAEALGRYMHAAVDIGLGALNIVYPLLDSPDWPDRRTSAERLLERLVERARHAGGVGPDVTITDIALVIIRFGRPLAIGLPPDKEREIAHRHIDTYLLGLATRARNERSSTPATGR
jgi:AcrR family transcriptional regulator